jgi:hypothetical protein
MWLEKVAIFYPEKNQKKWLFTNQLVSIFPQFILYASMTYSLFCWFLLTLNRYLCLGLTCSVITLWVFTDRDKRLRKKAGKNCEGVKGVFLLTVRFDRRTNATYCTSRTVPQMKMYATCSDMQYIKGNCEFFCYCFAELVDHEHN